MRNEEDSEDGWRAVNLYQIGATLHDLIMKKEIYLDKTPYSNLVIAIKEDIPSVRNEEVKYDLIQLTRNLLIRDWKKRLEICSLSNINDVIHKVNSTEDHMGVEIDKDIEEILHHSNKYREKFEELQNIQRSNSEKAEKRRELADKLKSEVEIVLDLIRSKGIYETLLPYHDFYYIEGIGGIASDFKNKEVRNMLYHIKGSLKTGYPNRHFCLLIRTVNDENNFASIYLIGIFSNREHSSGNYGDPLSIIKEIVQEKRLHKEITYFEAFSGVVEFDESFRLGLTSKIVKLLKRALKEVEAIVAEELAVSEKILKSGDSTFKTLQQRTIIIYKDI